MALREEEETEKEFKKGEECLIVLHNRGGRELAR